MVVAGKQTMPDGDPTGFEFIGDVNVTLADDQTISVNKLAGTYTVTELTPVDWDLIAISCGDDDSTGDLQTRTATIKVADFEVVTCIFTNEWSPKNFLPLVTN